MSILDVTSRSGYVLSLEYINTIRLCLSLDPIASAEYETAVAEAMKLGRDAVIAMHNEAYDRLVYGSPI